MRHKKKHIYLCDKRLLPGNVICPAISTRFLGDHKTLTAVTVNTYSTLPVLVPNSGTIVSRMDQCGILNRIIEEWFALIVWPVTLKMNILILCVATSAATVKVSDYLTKSKTPDFVLLVIVIRHEH